MRENKIESSNKGHRILAIMGVVAMLVILAGVVVAYGSLRDLWLEQCVIRDVSSQVSITDGRMVRADVVAEQFGLKNGANLALIDFDEKRRKVLKKIPNIRAITVERHLPDRVDITVEERVPVVRLNIRGRKGDSGRVADTEGVVFNSSSGTQTLPTIREAAAPGTQKGQVLAGRVLAALKLVETCREKFSSLAVIEADASRPDYIMIVLGTDYSRAKVAWDGMDDPTPATMPALERQLKCLSDAIASRVDGSIRVWDATIPNRAFGDTQKGFL